MPRARSWVGPLLVLAALAGPVQSDPPPAPPATSPYGDTYTPAELAALDRALHAGNLTREDLTFRKDMAKGRACLPVVKEMLRDPLLIAPKLDELAAALQVSSFANPENPEDPEPPPRDAEGLFAVVAALDFFREEAAKVGLVELSRNTVFAFLQDPLPEVGGTSPQETALRAIEQVLAIPVELLTGPGAEPPAAGDLALRVLRRHLPDEALMREVFTSPFDAATEVAIAEHMKGRPADYVPGLALELVFEGAHALPRTFAAFGRVYDFVYQAAEWPKDTFPADRPLIRDTPHGRIALGTLKDDVYEGDFAAIVDPGGNDTYRNGRFAAAFGTEGRRVGLLVDLGGDDVYDCGGVDCTLGAAILGVGYLLDRGQGNDRYIGGHLSLGAAVGGMALLHDDGGSDVYQGKSFTQGAAAYGVGILLDQSLQAPPVLKTDEETKDPIAIAAWDNDRLSAWCTAQGFSRTLGVALCINDRGNDVYEAGGVYLHAPLFADRYQSFSQGFSIGAREHDIAGGVAALIDRAGNDRYLGDIYNQGVGYWYSAGLLWDGGGNDLYEMTQYGQGSGIHLAVGGLVDVSGSDAYVMHSGLGQGGSHDWAASILHDRGGNDRYHGNTSCNGCALTNAVGLFIDRGGDDTYAARKDGGLNAGRPARGAGSVGLFVDLGGKDHYLGTQTDGSQWRGSDVGLGIDVTTEEQPAGGAGGTSEPNQLTGKAEIPAVVKHEGPLTEKVFDELWAIACRWEVGDNRVIVPQARKRLVAFGKDVLPLLDARMEKEDTGLALRAYVDVLKGLAEAGARPEVVALLEKNAAAASLTRRKTALGLIGELKVKEAEAAVVTLLGSDDVDLWRRAPSVLLALGSHAGDATLREWLGQSDERRHLVALGTLLGLDAEVYAEARHLLDAPHVSVRSRLATLLAERRVTYGKAVLADLGAKDLSERALRTLLDAVARGPIPPDADAVARIAALLAHSDWGMRADAARVLRAWQAAKDADAALLKPAADALAILLDTETDPFVRSQAGDADDRLRGVRPR